MHMFGVDAKVYSRSMHVMWKIVGGELLRLMPFGKVELDYDIMPFGKVESDCDITPFGRVKSDCDIMGRDCTWSELTCWNQFGFSYKVVYLGGICGYPPQ